MLLLFSKKIPQPAAAARPGCERAVIYIKETHYNEQATDVRVDGILDSESMHVLEKVCERHWEAEKKVLLHLGGLLHISREGRDFLKKIQDRVDILEPPKFIKLEGDDPKD